MSKDEKINFKLEVFKDKNSGKLSIMAHFDKSAPNIYKDKENFLWAPTVEEKDFLYEAFKMIPEGSPTPPSKDYDSKSEETKETDDTSEQEKPEEVEYSSETQLPEKDTKTTEKTTEDKLEKSSEESVSSKDTKSEDTNDTSDTKKEKTNSEVDNAMLEELDDDELKTPEDEQDKALIVEADSDAIDEALKKHTKNDDSIVEADEQTIIDKVLSQKKKGRWSRK